MKEFEIWHSGHVSLDGRNNKEPRLVGKSYGETFIDAVQNFRYPEDRKVGDYVLDCKGSSIRLDLNQDKTFRLTEGQPSEQLVPFYDNEADARKRFDALVAARLLTKRKKRR